MIKRYYFVRVRAINDDAETSAFSVFEEKSIFMNPLKAMERAIKNYNSRYGAGNWVVVEFKRIK